MSQKNKHLRLVFDKQINRDTAYSEAAYPLVLAQLALAQAMLAKHKSSAMPHFIAIIKELEKFYGFRFEVDLQD